MGALRAFIMGCAIGAGAMYLFDPETGVRRRALLRDRWARPGDGAGASSGDRATEIGARLRELAAGILGRLSRERAPDDILAARVRSNLGRVLARPDAVAVAASYGRVTLSGAVSADDAPRLVASTRLVRGVESVDNRLDAYESAKVLPEPPDRTPSGVR